MQIAQKPPVGAQINWGHPLAQGLVGCWLFNEGGGTKAQNLARQVYATIQSPAILTPDGVVNAANQTTSSALNETLTLSGNFTVFLKFKVTQLSNAHIFLASSDGTQYYGANYSGYPIYVTGSTTHISAAQLPTNTILTHAFVSDASVSGRFKEFKDGAFQGNRGTGVPTSASFTVMLDTLASHLRGTIYHMYVFNRALLNAEIKQLHETPYQFLTTPGIMPYLPRIQYGSVNRRRG